MRAMRNEGTTDAAAATTAISATATPANTIGSVGRTPYSRVVISRVTASAPARPNASPIAASRIPCSIRLATFTQPIGRTNATAHCNR